MINSSMFTPIPECIIERLALLLRNMGSLLTKATTVKMVRKLVRGTAIGSKLNKARELWEIKLVLKHHPVTITNKKWGNSDY